MRNLINRFRTDVGGIFPNDRALIRLAGMLCIDQKDEWLVGRGYLSDESISLLAQGLLRGAPALTATGLSPASSTQLAKRLVSPFASGRTMGRRAYFGPPPAGVR